MSWSTSKEVPTLYPTTDAKGKDRLIMFSGTQDHVQGAIRMSISEDEGVTWSELKPIGNYKGIVAMADCIPLKDAGHYLATFHIRGPENSMILYQVESWDGGLSWEEPKELYRASTHHLCEAGLIYSPDKSEIAMLLRENARNYNSQIMDNTPRNRPGNEMSPTEGDWVGWVGSWDDLKNGYEGQFRIRFKDNKKGWDTTYPAAELLTDGTLVCTTYGHWEEGEQPYILSFRFKANLLDNKLKEQRKNALGRIQNVMN